MADLFWDWPLKWKWQVYPSAPKEAFVKMRQKEKYNLISTQISVFLSSKFSRKVTVYQTYIKAFDNTTSPFYSNIHNHWFQDRPIPSQRKYVSMWRLNKNWLHTFYTFYLILTAYADHCNTKGKITTQTTPEHDLSDFLSQLPVQLSNL